MKVLIGCEYSGVVRDAFIAAGHDAVSCDILPTESPGPHIQGDIFSLLNYGWDMIIAFPPCTHLSSAGAPSWAQKQKDGRQQAAIEFVKAIYHSNCKWVAIENPVGKLSTAWRKPDQIIHPYHFGEPFMKRTCLWLKGLPVLKHTNVVEPTQHFTSNSTRGGLLKDGTRKKSKLPIRQAWDNAKDRSKSFPGIAQAMAEQWGTLSRPQGPAA